jgi:glycosyltransferase involved in cell wall biosynthesis
MRASAVSVSHSGVHQAYQLALAAQESGELDRFYCSVFVAPGKWGAWAQLCFGKDRLASRQSNGIAPERVLEHPWPLLRHTLKSRLFPSRAQEWFSEAEQFDRWVARRLAHSSSRIFVGTETCAQHSLRVAGAAGMIRVLDCPQWHPAALQRVLNEGARRIGRPEVRPLDSEGMARRKEAEFQSADLLLVYSDSHRRSFEQAGIPATRLFQCPLWADPALWFPVERRTAPKGPLRVIFVGNADLRKGVFFLLEAAGRCANSVTVTIAGRRSPESAQILNRFNGSFRHVGPQSKAALREIYGSQDVLVLPSLADSFGFVALEAMACGLPVIVSENCGVPVPDPSWRVPLMVSEAIARRLEYYADDREALQRDGLRAREFARQFTPERYREQIKALFRTLLGDGR